MISQQKWNRIGVNFCKTVNLNYSKCLTAIIANKGDAIKYWTLVIDLCPIVVGGVGFRINLSINIEVGKYVLFFCCLLYIVHPKYYNIPLKFQVGNN